MKRVISIIVIVALVLSVSTYCFAAEAATVSPRYSHISKCAYDLSINTSGVATCKASCTALSSSNKVKILCLFQGYNGSTWATIRTWTSTAYSVTSMNKQANIHQGWTDYRMRVTFSIYDSSDNLLENVTYYDYDYYLPST